MRIYLLFLCLFTCCKMVTAQQFYTPAGDATMTAIGEYNLTPAEYAGVKFVAGAVWCSKQVSLNTSFDLRFKMSIDIVRGSGADGACIVFGENITQGSVNKWGGYLGYYNEHRNPKNPEFVNSFAIEIDHYQNGFETNDPIPHYDHLQVTRDGDYYAVIPGGEYTPIHPAGERISTGRYDDYLIRWSCADSTLKIYYNDELRITCKIPYRNIFKKTDNITWGFTGGAAASYSNHMVKDIRLIETSSCIRNEQFSIHPMTNGHYHIKGFSATVSEVGVKVFDYAGQMVYFNTFPTAEHILDEEINLDYITEGIYIVRFSTRRSNKAIKFAVRK